MNIVHAEYCTDALGRCDRHVGRVRGASRHCVDSFLQVISNDSYNIAGR